MKTLALLSEAELLKNTSHLVQEERRITLELIEHLREIQMRRLHESLGYSSLHAFVTGHLGLSEGAAQRRISALYLSKELPEVTQKIQSGALSLSSVSSLQTFFKNQKKLGMKPSVEEKREVIAQVEGLSRKETEKTLYAIQPEALPQAGSGQKVSLPESTLAKLQKLQSYWSHKMPEASHEEILDRLIADALSVEEKKRFGTTGQETKAIPPVVDSHSAAEYNIPTRPAIPAEMRRQVWRKAQGRCEFTSSQGRRCNSQRTLEIDHIIPWSHNPEHDLKNLRLLCRAHNLRRFSLASARSHPGSNARSSAHVGPPARAHEASAC